MCENITIGKKFHSNVYKSVSNINWKFETPFLRIQNGFPIISGSRTVYNYNNTNHLGQWDKLHVY